MSARYFTHKSGKFEDGCVAIKFDRDGCGWFVKDDAARTLVVCKLWALAEAENNVGAGMWIEVAEQYILPPKPRDRPVTEVDAW